MGVIIQQSIKSSIVSYVGVLIGFVNMLVLYPSILSQEEVGLIETIRAIVLLLSPFAVPGIHQSVLKFFPQYSHKGKDTGFYTSITILLSAWLLLFYLLLISFSKDIYELVGYSPSDLQNYEWLISLSLLCYICYNLLATISSSSLKITLPRLMDSVVIRLLTMLFIVLYGLELISFNALIISISIAYIIPMVVLVIYLIQLKVVAWKINYELFQWQNLKALLKYASYTLFASMSLRIIQKIDVVMIGKTEDLSAVGIYIIAFFIGSAIEIPSRNIGEISFPILSRAFEKNDLQEIDNIYKKSSINQMIIGGLLLLLVWTCLDDLFLLMPNGEAYAMGRNVVFIISFGKLIDMIMGVNSKIIQTSKFYKYNLYLYVLLSVMVIFFNHLLIPQFSIVGAALASLLALFLYNMLSFAVVFKKMGIQPLSKQTLMIGALIGVSVAIGFWLPSFSWPVLSIAYKAIVLTALYGISIYYLKVSPEANKLIEKGLKKVF